MQQGQREWLRVVSERLNLDFASFCYQYGLHLERPVIVIADMKSAFGRWCPTSRVMTFSRDLLLGYSWDTVREVLKHEMAHQLVTDVLAPALGRLGEAPHGQLFTEACVRLGVAEWARAASGELPTTIPDWRTGALSEESAALMRKAERLLALAGSTNEHEAALAMARVRELYAKYNLEDLRQSRQAEHVHCVINRKAQRMAAEEARIFGILSEHFFVRCVFDSHFDTSDLREYQVVEILGTRANVEMAEYVYHFLLRQLNSLWEAYRRRDGVTGRLRGSYRLGVISGVASTLAKAKSSAAHQPVAGDQALVRTASAALNGYVTSRHPRLVSRRRASAYRDGQSYAAGQSDGAQVSIHRPVSGSSAQGPASLAPGRSP